MGGLIFGGRFVLVIRGAYIRGGLCSGFYSIHIYQKNFAVIHYIQQQRSKKQVWSIIWGIKRQWLCLIFIGKHLNISMVQVTHNFNNDECRDCQRPQKTIGDPTKSTANRSLNLSHSIETSQLFRVWDTLAIRKLN